MTIPTTKTAEFRRSDARAASAGNGVDLRGVVFDGLTEAGTIAHILEQGAAGRGGWLVTSNLDHLRRATRDAGFESLLESSDLLVADGMPLIWAAWLQGTPLPERVAGSTLSVNLAAAAAQAGRSLFLLGGNPGVADAAAAELTRRHPALKIAGTWYPPLGFEQDSAHLAAMREALDRSGADIVYVALGSPKQERLIGRLRDQGVLPDAWWIGVGISLSFITGDVKRAPRWLQRIGFEWVHRLTQEPGRLFRRYIIQGVPFALSLLTWAAVARLRGRRT